jgi:hypothetical protein
MLVFTPTVAMAGPNYVWNNSAYPGLPAVYGCKAIDSKNVYSCGNPDGVGNYILYYDGTALSVQHPPAPFVTLHGVDGSDPGHVWTVGNGGYVAFSNGSGTWATQASGTGDTLYGVVAIARDNAWAVGGHAGASTATHWNGTNWTATSIAGAPLHGITAFDASNVWAVGENGIILFYNGTTTVAQASGTASTIYSVSAVAPNDVWAVGAGGLALHFNRVEHGRDRYRRDPLRREGTGLQERPRCRDQREDHPLAGRIQLAGRGQRYNGPALVRRRGERIKVFHRRGHRCQRCFHDGMEQHQAYLVPRGGFYGLGIL